MTNHFSKKTLKQFLKEELLQCLRQKKLSHQLLNLFSFPLLSIFNYRTHLEWVSVFNKIQQQVEAEFFSVKIAYRYGKLKSFSDRLTSYNPFFLPHTDYAHIIKTKNYLYFFPYSPEKTSSSLMRMLHSPVRIKYNSEKGGFQQIDIPTYRNSIQSETRNKKTYITLKITGLHDTLLIIHEPDVL